MFACIVGGNGCSKGKSLNRGFAGISLQGPVALLSIIGVFELNSSRADRAAKTIFGDILTAQSVTSCRTKAGQIQHGDIGTWP